MIQPRTCPITISPDLQDTTSSKFQHVRHKGKRVHTPLKDGGSRCTVCGKERK